MKFLFAIFLVLAECMTCCNAQAQAANPPAQPSISVPDISMIDSGAKGSVYIPVDSWIYPAIDRLHALGYVDSAYLGMRPWTRISLAHMLELSADHVETDAGSDEARSIYFAVWREVRPDTERETSLRNPHGQVESVYTLLRGISRTPLHDSYHLGETIANDYGRPYESGFNSDSGFSARAEAGRFSLYFRDELQSAPSAAGYSPALADYLSACVDGIPPASFNNNNPVFYCNGVTPPSSLPQDTIPEGPISSVTSARVMEASLSYHVAGHEFSFGKNDHWLGPNKGASMLWGNNSENIYAFDINKTEPFRVPGLSTLTGPFRYEFFVGSLKGHTYPNDPWVHMQKISFKPTRNLEFGFSRLVIWGGQGHVPITLHSFLKSFFSFQNVPVAEKRSRDDPGARFETFDFSYRLPHLRRWVTIYTDSLSHDDVSPIAAPLRSGFHPGIYLARFPGLESLDLRLEGASTDAPDATEQSGKFLYWENIQRQGPTNKGFLVGDWVGRQGKGVQGWLTYHLSPSEEIQFTYRNAKAATAFIPGGTTQNDFMLLVQKRIHKDVEIRGWVQYEGWKAPIYKSGAQSDITASFQLTWLPGEKK